MAVDNEAAPLSPTSEISSGLSTPKKTRRSPPLRSTHLQSAWNEQSPLLAAERRDSDISTLGRNGVQEQLEYKDEGEDEESKSTWYLVILTLSIGGYVDRFPVRKAELAREQETDERHTDSR